jgi:hypothetical protein
MDESLVISWCEQLSTTSVEISSMRVNNLTENLRLKKRNNHVTEGGEEYAYRGPRVDTRPAGGD